MLQPLDTTCRCSQTRGLGARDSTAAIRGPQMDGAPDPSRARHLFQWVDQVLKYSLSHQEFQVQCDPGEAECLITHGRLDVLSTLVDLGFDVHNLIGPDFVEDPVGRLGRNQGTLLMLNDDVHMLLAFWQMLLHEWSPLECMDASACDRIHLIERESYGDYGTRSGRCHALDEESPPGVCAQHGAEKLMRAFIGLALEMAADLALASVDDFELQEKSSRLRPEWTDFGELVRSRRVSTLDVARFCDSVLEPNIVAWRRANGHSSKERGNELMWTPHCGVIGTRRCKRALGLKTSCRVRCCAHVRLASMYA